MKKCLFTAVLLFSCTLSFNQTRLSGKVTDKTGEELIGCTLKLMQLERMVKGTITDYDGVFVFKEIEQGMYDIEVSYTGYTPFRLNNIFVKARGDQKMDTIQLERIAETGCDLPGIYAMHSFKPTLAFNQTHLSGKVTDETSEELIGATVKLMRENYTISNGTITDFDGNYVFKAVEPGTYNIEVSYTGYQTSRTDGVVVKADSINKLDVSLGVSELHSGCGIIIYCYPMLNKDPGNTGTTFTSAQLYRKD